MTADDRETLEQRAALYALGALTAEEASAFEALLARSADARRLVAEYRETAALLPLAEAAAPPPDLRRRMLARVAGERRPAAEPRRSMPIGGWLALAASLLLALAAGAGWYREHQTVRRLAGSSDSLRQTLLASEAKLARRERTLNSILEPGVRLDLLSSTGHAPPAIQLFMNPGRGAAIVHAVNLEPAPAGKAYQLWFIQNGKPVPSVTFNSEPSGHALVERIPIPAGPGITQAAVTLEPEGGSAQPTSPILLLGPAG